MAGEFEENVLIPKREYVTLKERAEKSSTGQNGDNCNGAHMRAGKDCNCVDNPNGSGQSDKFKDQVKVDTGTHDSPGKEKNTRVEDGDKASQVEEGKNISQTEATAKVSPTKDKPKMAKDPESDTDGSDNNDTRASSHKPAEEMPADSQDEHLADTPADVEKPRDIKDQVVFILSNVPAGLRDKARILVQYILDSGRGIIEWDDKLQFIYMKQTMPRTDIVKLLVYTLEKEGKAPKGASVFLRSLQSIGLGKPREYVAKQLASSDKVNDKETNNSDTGPNEPAVHSETDMSDVPDGQPDGGKAGPVRTSQRKKSRFTNLKGKWFAW